MNLKGTLRFAYIAVGFSHLSGDTAVYLYIIYKGNSPSSYLVRKKWKMMEAKDILTEIYAPNML